MLQYKREIFLVICFLCRSFAYLTVRDRLPTILTKVVDTIHRNKNKFFEEYGEVRPRSFNWGSYEVHVKTCVGFCRCFPFIFNQVGIQAEKQAISLLSKLRNELQTDKPVLALTDGLPDTDSWNQYLERQQRLQGDQEPVSWFKSPWLYVECYMYRRIHEALLLKWEAFICHNGSYCRCKPWNFVITFSILLRDTFIYWQNLGTDWYSGA